MKLFIKKYGLLILILLLPIVVNASNINYNSICSEKGVMDAMRIIGYVIQVCRWIAPLILMVLGMVDFGKAAIASDEKALSNATASLIRRFVASVVIFFIPTIVLALLNAIEITKGIEDKNNSQFGACTKCIFDPIGECPIK